MIDPAAALKTHDLPFYYRSFSALDRFFRIRDPGHEYLLVRSSLISLARIFEELSYPGLPFEDAVLHQNGTRYVFHCYDELDPPSSAPFTVQELLYDPERDVFLDPREVYADLRRGELVDKPAAISPVMRLAEAARLVSRYHYRCEAEPLEPPLPEIDRDSQRELLSSILTSRYPDKGLRLLQRAGFIEAYWPELHGMMAIPQVKDYHPEGDAWEHTLQTFQYRKQPDLILSLALLLHDVGKPAAFSGTAAGRSPAEAVSVEKPFDGHAELGADMAARFLGRLGFSKEVLQAVSFLVRFHMMPAALRQLPIYRTERLMDSPLFPRLLELYRADSSASYWGPEGYYEACRVYRAYQRNRTNPYRRNDGRKQSQRSRQHAP